MNDVSPTPPRRALRWVFALVIVIAVGLCAWFGYRYWSGLQLQAQQRASTAAQQLSALEQSLEQLRRDQRANARSVQDAAATNRVLRDELLGLGQRSALLEETVERLAISSDKGTQALHQDEVELVLSQAQQRLLYAGDLDGARRLYALATNLIDRLDQPTHLNLRQALMQERAALDALGPGIRTSAQQQLSALAEAMEQLPDQAEVPGTDPQPWWQKLLTPLVKIRPADGSALVARSERVAAADSLQIEFSLARAAIERGDSEAFVMALDRIDLWLTRLWPDSPTRKQQRQALRELRAVNLRPALPELGSTLQQLRSLREGGTS
jgi:uroporphyrin-3 C-methyltransferase